MRGWWLIYVVGCTAEDEAARRAPPEPPGIEIPTPTTEPKVFDEPPPLGQQSGPAADWSGLPWAEGVFCVGMMRDEKDNGRAILRYFNMDTGESVDRGLFSAEFMHISSLAVFEDSFQVCHASPTTRVVHFVTVQIETGAQAITPILCEAVTDVGVDSYILEDGDTVRWVNRDPQDNIVLQGTRASRIGHADGDSLLTSRHAGNTLTHWDLQTGGATEVVLDQYDGWIEGMSEVDGRLFVVSDGRNEYIDTPWIYHIVEFTLNGDQVNDLIVGERGEDLQGLSCHRIP